MRRAAATRRAPPARPALALALLLGAVAGLMAAPAGAQEPMRPVEPVEDTSELTDPEAAALDAEAADVAAQLRCPVCTGQSVLESNSAIAQEMQEVVRERLAAGESEAEVLEYFRGAYGDWIILRPRATGWGLLVYVLPALALAAGGAWLFVVLRRWSRAGGSPPAAGAGGRGGARTPDTATALAAEDEAWLRRSMGSR